MVNPLRSLSQEHLRHNIIQPLKGSIFRVLMQSHRRYQAVLLVGHKQDMMNSR